jgi:hypothetical protein
MKSFYSSSRKIRYRVPAPSVCFGVGVWMVAARQSSWGKGAAAGEEARRGRIAIPEWRTGNPACPDRQDCLSSGGGHA